MFDAVSTPLEIGAAVGRPTESTADNSFTPLPKDFQETITQVPEFKPGEPSISNPMAPSDEGKDDYLAKLTDEIKQMAQQQGLDPDKEIPDENSATEHPPKKINIVQRIKNSFKKFWVWSKDEIDNFIKKLQGNKTIPKS